MGDAAVTRAWSCTVAVSSSEVHPSMMPPGVTINVVMLTSFAVHWFVFPVTSLTHVCAVAVVGASATTPSRMAANRLALSAFIQ
ncbi:MAG TPA: hypothetical protein VNO26_05965 [Candidatus Limnocylindria bacterium]|nr:hypothetical protein [Candidatus Limnocylindria bacterium]